MIPYADHVCAVCESDCDKVTYLRQSVRLLEAENFALRYALVEAQNLRSFALNAIQDRFPPLGAVR